MRPVFLALVPDTFLKFTIEQETRNGAQFGTDPSPANFTPLTKKLIDIRVVLKSCKIATIHIICK